MVVSDARIVTASAMAGRARRVVAAGARPGGDACSCVLGQDVGQDLGQPGAIELEAPHRGHCPRRSITNVSGMPLAAERVGEVA